MEKNKSRKQGQAKDLVPGMLVIINLDHRYDFMIWGGQDLNDSRAHPIHGRIWIEKYSIGLLIKDGLNCYAVLAGENTIIVPKNWCECL